MYTYQILWKVTFTTLKLTVRTCQVAPSQKENFIFQPSIFRCYCWWKKSQTTTWDVKNPINNGISYQPQLVSRISEPSTVSWCSNLPYSPCNSKNYMAFKIPMLILPSTVSLINPLICWPPESAPWPLESAQYSLRKRWVFVGLLPGEYQKRRGDDMMMGNTRHQHVQAKDKGSCFETWQRWHKIISEYLIYDQACTLYL